MQPEAPRTAVPSAAGGAGRPARWPAAPPATSTCRRRTAHLRHTRTCWSASLMSTRSASVCCTALAAPRIQYDSHAHHALHSNIASQQPLASATTSVNSSAPWPSSNCPRRRNWRSCCFEITSASTPSGSGMSCRPGGARAWWRCGRRTLSAWPAQQAAPAKLPTKPAAAPPYHNIDKCCNQERREGAG